MRRRQIVLGAIGVLWGGALLVKGLVTGVPVPGSLVFLFATVFLVVGARAIVKEVR